PRRMTVRIKTAIANDSHLLKELSREITDELRSSGASEEQVFDIRVAIEEALRNAMIHGNKLDPAKKVSVEADLSEGRVRICVEDEGDGFDPGKIPDPTAEENILKTSGRGVYMMNHLMDDVSYDKGGRRVIMEKCLKKKRS
nr:ATP-binding protein [Candidatus Omnitrophota bacterium]